jgi:hypothetical protein
MAIGFGQARRVAVAACHLVRLTMIKYSRQMIAGDGVDDR